MSYAKDGKAEGRGAWGREQGVGFRCLVIRITGGKISDCSYFET